MGDPADFTNFMCAVIDRDAFRKIKSYIGHAKRSKDAKVLCGGGCRDDRGYFVEPTVVLTRKADDKLLTEAYISHLNSTRLRRWVSRSPTYRPPQESKPLCGDNRLNAASSGVKATIGVADRPV
jgi:hypothetical protein